MELNQDMEALIRQHLPAMSAGVLSTFISEAKEDAAAHEELKKKYEHTQADLTAHKARASTIEQAARINASRSHELDTREAKLRTEELALDLAKNRLVADVAMAELRGVKDTVGSFLRNTIVRSNVTETVGVPVVGSPGGNGSYPTPGTVLSTHQSHFKTEERE